MNKVVKDDCCGSLLYKPTCDKCTECGVIVANHYCEYSINECGRCDNGYCFHCFGVLKECCACTTYICPDCYQAVPEDADDNMSDSGTDAQILYICNDCYVDGTVECDKCRIKCKLLYEGADRVWNSSQQVWNKFDEQYEMQRCEYKDCTTFVCDICTKNDLSVPEEDGEIKKCSMKSKNIGHECYRFVTRCKEHLSDVVYCRVHDHEYEYLMQTKKT